MIQEYYILRSLPPPTPGLSPVDDRSYFKRAVAMDSGMEQKKAYEYSVLSIVEAALSRENVRGIRASGTLQKQTSIVG